MEAAGTRRQWSPHRQRERPPAGRDLARDGPLARHRREEALPPKGESVARFISIRGNFEESSRRALWAFTDTPFLSGQAASSASGPRILNSEEVYTSFHLTLERSGSYTSHPNQSGPVNVARDALSAPHCALSPGSRDTRAASDWLRWLVTSAAVGRKLKRSASFPAPRP